MSNYANLTTPVFVCETDRLQRNLERAEALQAESGVTILHSLKGFALEEALPLIDRYLGGASASSLYEATLARKCFGGEVHTYAPAYKANEVGSLATVSDKLIFNSLAQCERFAPLVAEAVSCGLRINPHLAINAPHYCNPNHPASRLGIPIERLTTLPQGVEGLHLHALYRDKAEGMAMLLEQLRTHCGDLLPRLQWLNLGGGHAFTHDDYDTTLFVEAAQAFLADYPRLKLYIEPSEAVVYRSGVLVSEVLDIVGEKHPTAILDISIEAHLTDLLHISDQPAVRGTHPDAPYRYTLGGVSCASGDIVGEYGFAQPLQIGDRVVFEDMMGYTMVKMTRFNGIAPAKVVAW